MLLAAIGLVGFVITVSLVTEHLEPFFNKFFAKVWSENTGIKRSTVERIKELYIDTDKNEEAVLLQASIEEDVSREQILNAFNALDGKDLANIVRGNPRDMFTKLNKLMDKKSKRGMYGKK